MWLRYGWIDPMDITPIRINFNPALNRGNAPSHMGEQPIRPHKESKVRESFAKDGIRNPVFLWARYDKVWVRYGGSRVVFAQENKLPEMAAIIADYDDRYPDLETVSQEQAMAKFTTPPIGLTPNGFVYRDAESLDLDVTLWREAVG